MATEKTGDALMDFTAMCEPFGGAPSEEVFVKFGVDMNEYKRRLFTRLTNPDRAGLIGPALRNRLIDYSEHATGAPHSALIGKPPAFVRSGLATAGSCTPMGSVDRHVATSPRRHVRGGRVLPPRSN